MIKHTLNKTLNSMSQRYNYDVRYMQDILNTDLGMFFKYMGFQTMASHSDGLPLDILYAVRLRTIILDDCGPCTQLVVNMALEQGVQATTVQAIIDQDRLSLSDEMQLAIDFTERVIARNPEADELRAQVISKWGEKGLMTMAFCISAYRVFPALKYTLGYGKTCSRVTVNDRELIPSRDGL